jgi:hypothetical protein
MIAPSGAGRRPARPKKSTAAAGVQAITLLLRAPRRQGCRYFRGDLDMRGLRHHPFPAYAECALTLAKAYSPMKRISSQLRSATSRIVRRLAVIADIAAASLPSAGA